MEGKSDPNSPGRRSYLFMVAKSANLYVIPAIGKLQCPSLRKFAQTEISYVNLQNQLNLASLAYFRKNSALSHRGIEQK